MSPLHTTEPDPSTRRDANGSEGGPGTSKRRHWYHSPRPTEFAPAGVEFERLPQMPRVFVNTLPRSSALDSWVPAGCDVYEDGHHPVIRTGDGRTIYDGRSWFGEVYDDRAAVVAWRYVEREIQRLWQSKRVILLATPGTTGRDLWLRTPAADGCVIMSQQAQSEVRATAAQGRIELFPAAGRELHTLHEYDLRIAYAAVLRNLPTGEPDIVTLRREIEAGDPFLSKRSRVRCRFGVPADWNHIGLIGVRADDGSLSYPATPGYFSEPTWADGCEVELAARNGWVIEAEHAIVWPTTGDPLRLWADRLLSIMFTAAEALGPAVFAHVRAMIRSILLHTVGAFHGRPHRVTRTAPTLAGAPIGADMLRLHSDHVSWCEYEPARWPEAVHPEWSSHVWARNRRRLLVNPVGGGALTIPAVQIVAIRTDAIYTSEPTGWGIGKTNTVGGWALKGVHTVERWPSTVDDLLSSRGRR